MFRSLLLVLLTVLLGQGGAQAGPPDLRTCASALAALRAHEGSSVPNERIFVAVQARVLELGCSRPEQFRDPAWFERTSTRFVALFLAQEDDWPAVRATCRNWNATALSCVDAMVGRHIGGDLPPALREYGCGEANDWARVGDLIVQAAGEQGCLWGLGAWLGVPWQRDVVRQACLAGG